MCNYRYHVVKYIKQVSGDFYVDTSGFYSWGHCHWEMLYEQGRSTQWL